MTWPHPVINVATKHADAARRRMHQPHVTDLQLFDQVIFQTTVKAVDVATITSRRLAFSHQLFAQLVDFVKTVFTLQLRRQLLLNLLGHITDRFGH